MNKLKFALGLACMASSAVAFSQEANLCKSFCAADKKQCRSAAAYDSSIVTDPPISQHERPHPLGDPALDGRLKQQSADNFKHALNQKCEVSYMKCTQACKPPIEKSSVEK